MLALEFIGQLAQRSEAVARVGQRGLGILQIEPGRGDTAFGDQAFAAQAGIGVDLLFSNDDALQVRLLALAQRLALLGQALAAQLALGRRFLIMQAQAGVEVDKVQARRLRPLAQVGRA